MTRTVTNTLLVCAVAALSARELSSAPQTGGVRADRASVIAALEKLMTTGEPRHTSHDEGEWLQRAVDAAISNGDAGIERLAIRAAAPIVAHIRRPVASIHEPPSLDIDASIVLKVPRPLAYRADVHASVDGSDYALFWKLQSGQRANGKVHEGLPRHAFQPGYHSIRLKAHVTFGDPNRQDQQSWTEIRDLPDLAYALYDPAAPGKADPSAFLTAPLRTSAQQLDPTLPDLPLSTWLDDALASLERPHPKHEWRVMYCAERTAEQEFVPRAGDICSVMYLQTATAIGQIWVRTGQVRFGRSGPEWLQETPRLEAVTMERGTTASALSDLVTLLKSDPSSWPKGEVSIAPEDIVVTTTNGPPGAKIAATVTVQNSGGSPALGVLVEVMAATTESDTAVTSRHFVVDVPREGSTELKLDAMLAAGYGFVFVFAMHPSEHTPFSQWGRDDLPGDQVAFRVVNAPLAPKGYVEFIRAKCACSGW